MRVGHVVRDLMRVAVAVSAVLAVVVAAADATQPPSPVGPRANGTGVTPVGQTLTPAGRTVVFNDNGTYADRPFGIAISPDGSRLVITNGGYTNSLMVVDTGTGSLVQTIAYPGSQSVYLGVAYSADGRHVYASAGSNNAVRRYDVAPDGSLRETQAIASLPASAYVNGRLGPYPGGLSVSADGARLAVANLLEDSVSLMDPAAVTVVASVKTGASPYTTAQDPATGYVYVSNWGSNTVSVVRRDGGKIGDIVVGMHPNALVLATATRRLYVANGDDDSISVIDLDSRVVEQTIAVSPYPAAPVGSSPNAMVLSHDGSRLYVCNAGNNDVAVIDTASGRVLGLVPTGYYPSAIAISPDDKTLYVTNLKGLGIGANPAGPTPYDAAPPHSSNSDFVQGSLSIIPVPSPAQLQRLTAAVGLNNGFAGRSAVRGVAPTVGSVVPRRVGGPSPIKHVIYVIRENRTYDQMLGSLGRGNGAPKLALGSAAIAPNVRALARAFVTFDNFYATADVSADGWSWSTEATANSYVEKTWPPSYSGRGRGFNSGPANPAAAAGRSVGNSYIWDRLSAAGISYRNYGFQASGTRPAVVPAAAANLAANTDLDYPGFNLSISDQSRIDEWSREFAQYAAAGNLPTVEFIWLPNDHTAGTATGYHTPPAMLADNDLALGRLVDTVSHSRYWRSTAIFVVEDDAQNGPDHVNAHRTVALVISPYTQTGRVDSTFYNTVSMLRTIELIVGIGPLTQFDAGAMPMFAAFSATPNVRPYRAITPSQQLDAMNAANAAMARVSNGFDLAEQDDAPEAALNEAIRAGVEDERPEG